MVARRVDITRSDGFAYAGIGFALAMLFSTPYLRDVLTGGLISPDSYTRLTRLKESLRLGVLTHEVMRDGAGAGVIVPWSHLLDSLICLLAIPFLPFTTTDGALHLAAALCGPLGMAGLALAAAWAAAPFADRAWLWLAPVIVGLAPMLPPYALFGVAHHHGAAAIAVVMTAGWTARALIGQASRFGGVTMGAWAGLGVWLTPETIPYTLMALGAIWAVWATRRISGYLSRFVSEAAVTMFIVTALAWSVDLPPGGATAEDLDRVSIVHVVLTGAIAMIGIGLRLLDRLSADPWRRFWTSVVCGALFALDWIGLYPVVLLSPRAMLLDESARAMFVEATRGGPALGAVVGPLDGVDDWLRHMLGGAAATLALVVFAWRGRSVTLTYAAVCALAALLMAAWSPQLGMYPRALGAILLPVILSAVTAMARQQSQWWRSLRRVAVIASFSLVPLGTDLIRPSNAAAIKPGLHAETCPVGRLTGMLAPYAGVVVLTDADKALELRYRAEIVAVGARYHRDVAGSRRLREAWRTDATDVPPLAFIAAGIGYVLHCPAPGRSALVQDLPASTLLDRLNRGEVPEWLTETARDHESGYVLYRVGS